MKAIFIGENGSMGLKHGKMYTVCFSSNKKYPLILKINKIECPYSSIQSLLRNWRFV